MFLAWFRNRRRKKLFDLPLPVNWQHWISSNLWFWHVLNEQQRHRLSGLVQIFLAEKSFEGCDGLKITDEIRITVAAAACMLLLGFDDTYCFDRARFILVYPVPTMQRHMKRFDGSVSEFQWLSGLVQHRGPIVLSWRDVLRDCRNDQRLNNVVIHEFAHFVDGLDGAMEGLPPFSSVEQQEQWKLVSRQEIKQLRLRVENELPTVLDPYGLENPAEFFAVASEAFYCDGRRLHDEHRELYDLLASLYRIETKPWFHPMGLESRQS